MSETRPPRSRLIHGGAIAGGALVLALTGAALFGPHGVSRHELLRERLVAIRDLNHELREANSQLSREAEALRQDPEYIESVIRDELGWVRSDEVVFIFPADNDRRGADGGGD